MITFRGFLRAYEEGRDEPVADAEEERLCRRSPRVRRSRRPRSSRRAHSTTPPARYTEASLVKELEERGIGRPSTYAAIIGTILDRGYVRKQGRRSCPTFLAFAVVNLLERHFAQLVDYEFTARMEDDLDGIASGDEERTAWLQRFYFGTDGDGPARSSSKANSATSTPARSTRSRSATASSCASAGTGRTSSAATSARRCPPKSHPTS